MVISWKKIAGIVYFFFFPVRKWDTGRILSSLVGHQYTYQSELKIEWRIEPNRHSVVSGTAYRKVTVLCRALMIISSGDINYLSNVTRATCFTRVNVIWLHLGAWFHHEKRNISTTFIRFPNPFQPRLGVEEGFQKSEGIASNLWTSDVWIPF